MVLTENWKLPNRQSLQSNLGLKLLAAASSVRNDFRKENYHPVFAGYNTSAMFISLMAFISETFCTHFQISIFWTAKICFGTSMLFMASLQKLIFFFKANV